MLSRSAASTKEADFGSYLKLEMVPALIFSVPQPHTQAARAHATSNNSGSTSVMGRDRMGRACGRAPRCSPRWEPAGLSAAGRCPETSQMI